VHIPHLDTVHKVCMYLGHLFFICRSWLYICCLYCKPTMCDCYSAPDSGANVSVCLCRSVCVCLSMIMSLELHVHSSQIFVHVTYDHGSVLLWRRSDMLRISGFVDDVICAHKPRLLSVATQLRHSSHAALGLVINGM